MAPLTEKKIHSKLRQTQKKQKAQKLFERIKVEQIIVNSLLKELIVYS